MTRSIPLRLCTILVGALSLSSPAFAETTPSTPSIEPIASSQLTGSQARLARELSRFGYRDVDVRSLSKGQIAHISLLIHSNRSHGDISGHIGATLRRGFLQRTLDGSLRRSR